MFPLKEVNDFPLKRRIHFAQSFLRIMKVSYRFKNEFTNEKSHRLCLTHWLYNLRSKIANSCFAPLKKNRKRLKATAFLKWRNWFLLFFLSLSVYNHEFSQRFIQRQAFNVGKCNGFGTESTFLSAFFEGGMKRGWHETRVVENVDVVKCTTGGMKKMSKVPLSTRKFHETSKRKVVPRFARSIFA